MANSHSFRIAKATFGPLAFGAAGCARRIVFCRIGKDGQLLADLHWVLDGESDRLDTFTLSLGIVSHGEYGISLFVRYVEYSGPSRLAAHMLCLMRSMQPSVSIITTIYNTALFLDEAIASVVVQDQRDWELILVDDGSSDDSVEIARSWCAQNRRIRLLTHPDHENRGISASRNLGIRASSGSLIAFLDSDDVWLPGKLTRQIEILAAYPEASMTFGAAERWYSWDITDVDAVDFVVPSAIPDWGADRVIPAPELLKAFLQDESLTPCTCSVLARREAVLQASAFENSFRGLYDDQVFYAKLCLVEPVYVSSDCVARYRQHENSCCAVARSLGAERQGRDYFLTWLREYQSTCARSR